MTAPSYTKLPPSLTTPPPPVPDVLVAFPSPHILLVTLNRAKHLNAIPRPQHFALERLWDWYDEEPSLRCAVITGAGRAFCAGADLKEWDSINTSDPPSSSSSTYVAPSSAEITKAGAGVAGSPIEAQFVGAGSKPSSRAVINDHTPAPASASLPAVTAQPDNDKPSTRFPKSGFGGLSNRSGTKPVIAAVNGICFGGGMEMALNCDLVIAAPGATFALPEVTIGVIALAGALPRLVRTVGKQRAAEMALTGKTYTAREVLGWGVVNEVVDDEGGEKGGGKGGDGNGEVVEAALRWAEKIAGNSPDAVIVTREGLKLGWEGVGPEQGTDLVIKGWYGRIEKGENMVEGVRSFIERRKPVWKDSKL